MVGALNVLIFIVIFDGLLVCLVFLKVLLLFVLSLLFIIVDYNFVINFFIINFFIICFLGFLPLCGFRMSSQAVVVYCNVYWLWHKFAATVEAWLWGHRLIRSPRVQIFLWDYVWWHAPSHMLVSPLNVILTWAGYLISFQGNSCS